MSFREIVKNSLKAAINHLGEETLIYKIDDVDHEITGIFDENYQDAPLSGSVMVEDSKIMVLISTGDLPRSPRKKDKIVFKGNVYDVVNIIHDSIKDVGCKLELHWLGSV